MENFAKAKTKGTTRRSGRYAIDLGEAVRELPMVSTAAEVVARDLGEARAGITHGEHRGKTHWSAYGNASRKSNPIDPF